jgi:hypothetical protein
MCSPTLSGYQLSGLISGHPTTWWVEATSHDGRTFTTATKTVVRNCH